MTDEQRAAARELGRKGGLARAARYKSLMVKQALDGNGNPNFRKRHFPHKANLDQQIKWFRREFLRLADQAPSAREQADLLKMAYATLAKNPNPDDASLTELPSSFDLTSLDGDALAKMLGKPLSFLEPKSVAPQRLRKRVSKAESDAVSSSAPSSHSSEASG